MSMAVTSTKLGGGRLKDSKFPAKSKGSTMTTRPGVGGPAYDENSRPCHSWG